MTADTIVHASTTFALVVLGIALLVTVYRVVIGPTLPDRVIALDMLVGIAIGFIAVIALRPGYTVYIDIAIALGLVGFLATVAFARFILARGKVGEGEGTPLMQTSAAAAPSETSSAPRSGNGESVETTGSKSTGTKATAAKTTAAKKGTTAASASTARKPRSASASKAQSNPKGAK